MQRMRGNSGRISRQSKSGVSVAGISLKLNITRAGSAGLFVSTGSGSWIEETFNLATEHGCFYANGVLVSNSDALRYLGDVLGEQVGFRDSGWVPATAPAAALPEPDRLEFDTLQSL